MSPDEKLGRRIIGSFVLGIFVALANYALDVSFVRLAYRSCHHCPERFDHRRGGGIVGVYLGVPSGLQSMR